jgi:hypothetical protein
MWSVQKSLSLFTVSIVFLYQNKLERFTITFTTFVWKAFVWVAPLLLNIANKEYTIMSNTLAYNGSGKLGHKKKFYKTGPGISLGFVRKLWFKPLSTFYLDNVYYSYGHLPFLRTFAVKHYTVIKHCCKLGCWSIPANFMLLTVEAT